MIINITPINYNPRVQGIKGVEPPDKYKQHTNVHYKDKVL